MRLDTYATYPNDSLSKVSDLYTHVGRYRLHSALANLGVVGMKIFAKDQTISELHPQTINEWQLAFLAKALILNSNDHRQQEFGDQGLFKSAAIYNNLYDKFMETEHSWDQKQKSDAMNTFMIRMSHQQFPFQLKVGYLLPRALFLFHHIPKSLKDPKIDIELEVKKIFGLTPKQILLIGFAIFAQSDKGYFNPETIYNTESPELRKHLDRESVEKLVASATANYYKLRELFREDEGEDGLQQYSFNALRTFPIVQTQTSGLVIPVPRFILEKFTNGIFYSLVENLRQEKSNPFLEFFGKELFERYVGLLFDKAYKKEYLIKEFAYGKTNSKSPDWIIIEGDTAILIECKTSGITKEAKSWADTDQVRKDLRARAVHGLIQMLNFSNHVKSGQKMTPDLNFIKNFHYVVVTYDRIFLSGSPSIRDYINQELEEYGVKSLDYQIVGIDEVEKLIPVLAQYKFSNLLDQKYKDKEWSTYDFDLFLSSFLEKEGVAMSRENLMLQEEYETFMHEISPKLTLNKNG